MMAQQSDFARPVAPHRKRIYIAVAVISAITTLTPTLLVGFRVLPPEPTGFIWAVINCALLPIPLFVVWWDAPGENRTVQQRVYEFILVWFPVTALTEIWWELPWLILDLFGVMKGAGPDDRWVWVWWAYGEADTRYLTGSSSVWAMELVAVIAGIMFGIAWIGLVRNKAGYDAEKRIRPLFLGLVGCAVSSAVVTIYYVTEFRSGFADIGLGLWEGVVFRFILWNICWVFAPFISVPLLIKQIDSSYRALGAAKREVTTPTASGRAGSPMSGRKAHSGIGV
jgi:hypothetical protein